MAKSIFSAPIDLKRHACLIYAEGIFGLDARKKQPMRAKTADGILRYGDYKIAGVIDSTSKEKMAGDVLSVYLHNRKNFSVPIFRNIKEAKKMTGSSVLMLGNAPEGGELPKEYESDIRWAIRNKMNVVSGMHYPLTDDPKFSSLAKKHKVVMWDTRKTEGLDKISMCSARAYHIKKPIVLTVGTDAAIGKMTVAYEMHHAAQKLGAKSCVIPTGQTAIMIDGWGVSIDALPADFMAGAVEDMLFAKEKQHDILFVEGQGSLFHPAYANTCIALIHGAVPTHMVLVHRPQRKHSVGSRLVKLPDIKSAIKQYEGSILPTYRNAKVVGVALNMEGLSDKEAEKYKKEIKKQCGLPVFDALKDKKEVENLVKKLV